MCNENSLLRLQLKMLSGYMSLIILFVIASCIVVGGICKMEDNSHRYSENIERRNLSEKAFMKLFDLTQLDGAVSIWNDSLMQEYEEKEIVVLRMMDSLASQLPDTAQAGRVREIRNLVGEKKSHLLSIHADLEQLRDVNGLMKERMPDLINRANRANEQLTDEVSENLQENRHRTTGFRGLFKSKKKADEVTDTANRKALDRAKSQTDKLMKELVTDIELSQGLSTARLFAHMDTLIGRNRQLNDKITRLVTAFNHEDAQRRKSGSAHLMQYQRDIVRMIAVFGLIAFLLAVFFFWMLHRDLKQKEENKRELEESNQHNEELLTMRHNMMLTVSHDLRAPLTAITGYADLIADADTEGKRRQYSEAMRQSANRMLALLNTLLNYYRLDTGKDEAEVQPFKAKEALRAILSEFEPLATAKNLDIEGRFIGDESAVIVGDRKRIIQITSNLVSNAIKFTESGKVSVWMEHNSSELAITVKDTGTGMSEEQQKRIFTPFKRLENADTQEGFGLGLSITQALVELLGGEIQVDSMKGVGSCFRVVLPVSESGDELKLVEDKEPTKLPEGIRIAILDDDPMVLKMTVEMLRRKKVQADGCHTVDDLLDLLRKQPYDLIITDILLGGMSGFDLLELLRFANIGNSKSVPLLAMTGRTERSKEDFINAGFVGCLSKPFSFAELAKAILSGIGDAQPKEDSMPIVDFSTLLKGESDQSGMLSLLIEQTEQDTTELKDAVETGDTNMISFLLHKLESRWELLHIEKPLSKLRKTMEEGGDLTDAVAGVVAMSEQLVMQARDKMKGGAA